MSDGTLYGAAVSAALVEGASLLSIPQAGDWARAVLGSSD